MRKLLLLTIFALILAPSALAETSDQSAPLISAINVVEITKTTAKIIWTTDENATSEVSYIVGILSTPGLTTKHTILLQDLKPATSYYFNVTSCDAAKNCAKASGQGLKFATIGYREVDTRLQQSNLSKSVLTSIVKMNFLNFSEQNPIVLSIDSKEGLYFKYNDSEYAIIFPKQAESNTTIRLLPRNSVEVLEYGDEIWYDLDNDSINDVSFKLNTVKKTDAFTTDASVKYVKYQFNISIKDLNMPDTNKTEEARVKFEQNPVYESKYEPPVKKGSIGVLSSVLPERKASAFTGTMIAVIVFIATLLVIILVKGF